MLISLPLFTLVHVVLSVLGIIAGAWGEAIASKVAAQALRS